MRGPWAERRRGRRREREIAWHTPDSTHLPVPAFLTTTLSVVPVCSVLTFAWTVYPHLLLTKGELPFSLPPPQLTAPHHVRIVHLWRMASPSRHICIEQNKRTNKFQKAREVIKMSHNDTMTLKMLRGSDRSLWIYYTNIKLQDGFCDTIEEMESLRITYHYSDVIVYSRDGIRGATPWLSRRENQRVWSENLSYPLSVLIWHING